MNNTVSSAPDFSAAIVNKPWGYEYLMYENETVALWYLSLRSGAKTSLHCHPKKKTGLIVISGEVEVTFLADSMTLPALAKLMIRPGLFHSSMAVSPQDAVILEIETPCDKGNLVRLDDEFGREHQPYEGSNAFRPKDDSCINIQHPEIGRETTYDLMGTVLTVEKIMDMEKLKGRHPEEIIVVLDGGLCSVDGALVLGPGDVVSPQTLNRLTNAFSAPFGISLLSIHQ